MRSDYKIILDLIPENSKVLDIGCSDGELISLLADKNISAQVINDHDGKTLASASSLDKIIEKSVSKAKSKIEVSTLVGKTLAERAMKNKVKEVVFDRNGYPYHGRIKAVADAAREAGLKF